MEFKLLDGFRLGTEGAIGLRELLRSSFPHDDRTRTRTYGKQTTPQRLLALASGRLVGHLGLEHRVVGTSTGPAEVFGIVDVCVAPDFRGDGLASELLARAATLGAENGIDFLILFANDTRLYERSGFRREKNMLRWTMIHEHQTTGIAEEAVNELMVKPVGPRRWPAGLVDLLGHLF